MSWQSKQLTDNDFNSEGLIKTGMNKIITKPSNETYREGWERIFGKKKRKHVTKIKKVNVSVETTEDERNG